MIVCTSFVVVEDVQTGNVMSVSEAGGGAAAELDTDTAGR
jgi:hypothetical protein